MLGSVTLDWPEIASSNKPMSSIDLTSPTLSSRILGCWLGKSIGGTLGLPAEGKKQRLNFTYYDPVPVSAPPNDDLELQLVWLHLVETSGRRLSARDFAQAWLRHIHYMWDEYGRCRWNLRRGVPVDRVGTLDNPFHASMGSPIRSEIWACLFPGDPASAAGYAALDASLDHGVEGIAGEVFLAAAQSQVAAGADVRTAIDAAVLSIPPACETAVALRLVLGAFDRGVPTWESWEQLVARHATDNFTHAPLNVALATWALCHGQGDFERSILLAVNGGYDTDCTAATVGATLGLASGAGEIPVRWREPIGEDVLIGPGIRGIRAAATLGELTERTLALCGRLDRMEWSEVTWGSPVPTDASLSGELPGAIRLEPFREAQTVGWANGELPEAVKRAGGAEWDWTPATSEERRLVALAPKGVRLSIDGELFIDCPAGLPYVPATHRCPALSRRRFAPEAGRRYRIRVELPACDPAQQASVLLVYPDLHLCPWTTAELPDRAVLPKDRKWDLP